MMTEYIWQQFSGPLHGFILKQVQDEDTASDILQDVFIKIHQKLDSLKDKDKLRAWLYQITRNEIYDHWRKHKPELEPQQISIEDEKEALHDLEGCVRVMTKNLPEKYREVIELSELKEVKHREIAAALGLSISGVKTRVQRGRALLKEMMTDCCQLEVSKTGGVLEAGENCKHCG